MGFGMLWRCRGKIPVAWLRQPCAWSRGFLPTGISNPSSTLTTRSASEEKEEQKTPTKITQYESDSFIFHLLPYRIGLPSRSCHMDTSLGFARRCWHGKFVLPSHHHPFPVCLKFLFFSWRRLGKHKGDLLCTCWVFGKHITAMWVVQKAPAPQLLRDQCGTGQGKPKTSSIYCSAELSFLRAL